jgi:hypothetical protein
VCVLPAAESQALVAIPAARHRTGARVSASTCASTMEWARGWTPLWPCGGGHIDDTLLKMPRQQHKVMHGPSHGGAGRRRPPMKGQPRMRRPAAAAASRPPPPLSPVAPHPRPRRPCHIHKSRGTAASLCRAPRSPPSRHAGGVHATQDCADHPAGAPGLISPFGAGWPRATLPCCQQLQPPPSPAAAPPSPRQAKLIQATGRGLVAIKLGLNARCPACPRLARGCRPVHQPVKPASGCRDCSPAANKQELGAVQMQAVGGRSR